MRDQRIEVRYQEERRRILDGINGIYRMGKRDNILVDEFLINGMMELFDDRGVGAGKEFVEL